MKLANLVVITIVTGDNRNEASLFSYYYGYR